MLSDTTVRDYLERLVPLQEVAEETRDRLGEIKQEARSDGLNLDALNALLPVIGKYPHDKGARVLSEVIRYAEAFGAENLVSQADTGSHPPSIPVSNADVSQPAKAEAHSAGGLGRRSTAYARLRLSTQVVASVFVTIGLIWLLN